MYYKRILDALPELIFVTQADGVTPIFFNKTWFSYTGLTEKDVERGWRNIVHPDDEERITTVVSKAVEYKQPYEIEVRLKCCNGKYRWFLAKAAPVFDELGKVDSYVGLSVDIHASKLTAMERELEYERILKERLLKIEALESELEVHKTLR